MKKIKIKIKELHNYVKDESLNVYIDSIEGKTEILDTYVKRGLGRWFTFNDGSEIKCHIYHKFSEDCKDWKDAQHYNVGDTVCGKEIISIEELPDQEWHDFTCNNETESYIHNGIYHHNSGKSLTIFLLIRYILMETDFKILITVPSISLVEQLYQDFIDYTIDDWDIANEVTKVHSKAIENPNARVVISTWQTCAKKDSKYFQQFDAYLCDEAHSASAAETTKIINNLSHAKFRFGLTGTLDGTDLHELEMIGRFGRLYRVVSTADLMKSSDLAQLKVNFLKIKYPLTECKLITKKSTEYQQEIKYITEHEGRNKLLVKLGVNQNKNSLMLFNYVEGHGKVLYEMMKDQCADRGKKLFYISGETKPTDRERIRHEMEKSGNTLIGYDVKINGVNYCIKSGTLIALESGEQKTINELTKDDDICETWFEQNKANFQNFR